MGTLRFFYGWTVVAATFVVMFTAYCMQFGYGVFLPHMVKEMGWTRADVSTPFSIYLFTYSVLSYLSGRLTDRFGPTIVIVSGGVLMGLGYSMLAHVSERWQLLVFFGLVAGVGMSVVFVPCHATVVKWFARRRAFALGLMGTGLNLANLLGPLLATFLIAVFDWRRALEYIAVGGALIIVVAAQSLFRDPESRGLLPDGVSALSWASTHGPGGESGVSLGEALRTRALWLIFAIYSSSWLVLFFPYVHLPQHGLDLGMSPIMAAGLLGAVGIGGLIGRLLIGWGSELLGNNRLLVVCLVVQSLAMAAFAVSSNFEGAFIGASLYGVGAGGAVSLFAAIVGDIFGRRHAGSIVGFLFASASGPAALGPYLSALIRDGSGSYTQAFLWAAAMNLIAAALGVFLSGVAKVRVSSPGWR